jgi:hypothetical protein
VLNSPATRPPREGNTVPTTKKLTAAKLAMDRIDALPLEEVRKLSLIERLERAERLMAKAKARVEATR